MSWDRIAQTFVADANYATAERFEVIAHAQSLPLSKNGSPEWATFVKGLNKERPVIVHCASGRRAKRVAEELAQEGFHASYFKRPDQWKASGLPMEAGPAKMKRSE